MRVGIIAPIKFLGKYCKTSIQYCLPCLIVSELGYRRFYSNRASMGNIIILDCRKIGWKREPENFGIIRKALSHIDPTVVIAPSYMFNLKGTLKVQEDFQVEFSNLASRTVRCIEGTSEKEVPYPILGQRIAAPSHMYRYLTGPNLDSSTIYLDNHLSLEELLGKDGILVTSLPIRLGLQGRLLSDYRPTPPSLTFYEDEDPYPKITERNIEEAIDYYEE